MLSCVGRQEEEVCVCARESLLLSLLACSADKSAPFEDLAL